jgi:stage II sporulation protein D
MTVRRPNRAPLAVAMALLLASCAPLPPPQGGTPAPPQQTGGPPPSGEGPVPTPTPATAPPPRAWTREPTIDVGMAWELDSLTLAPASAATVWIEHGTQPRALASSASRVAVRRTSAGYAVSQAADPSRETTPLVPGDTLTLASLGDHRIERDAPQDGVFRTRWQGKTWRGHARVFVNARGTLTLAFRLPLETYLLGVVPGEIGGLAAELIEAGRAQAVAARSYTLYYYGRRGDEGFDVYGTVEDQVYGSVETERPLATRCVETTRGLVERSGGQPIRANYYSTCGGITADVEEGWPASGFPYLRSTRDRGPNGDWCAASPVYRWREEWAASEFLAVIAKYAPAEGVALPERPMRELRDLAVDARSRSGRVWRLRVDTDAGEVIVPAYALRRVVRRPGAAAALLRSNLFKIDVRRDPRTRAALSVVASGAGFGHGVGLCQTGALGMARAGRKGEQILAHYYPGADLRRLY